MQFIKNAFITINSEDFTPDFPPYVSSHFPELTVDSVEEKHTLVVSQDGQQIRLSISQARQLANFIYFAISP